ncbi:MAG: serine protease, partial [Kofleriaceae bacterium]
MRVPLRFALLVACAACSQDAVTASEHDVVYGADDRQDVYAFGDAAWAARAQAFSAVVVDRTTLDVSDPDAIELPAGTLQQAFELCTGERFANQRAAGLCSATLIAPDLVLTAGQCIDTAACSTTAFVFDYAMTSATVPHPITSADVYPCAALVARAVTPTLDYAIVRLDRTVTGRVPAVIAPGTSPVALGRDLLVAGFPSGLPLKLAGDGAVRDPRAATTDYFVANLDTFGGGTGAGVFDARSKQLVGIAVRGAADYVAAGSCNRVNACPETGCRGQDVTYAFRATAALCQTTPASDLCKCGDATCDPAIGETTASCPTDCSSACGDGACNGDETQASCAADCGTCGNATCDGGETTGTCCLDCGCALAGEVCLANTCAPDPVPGDSCAATLALTPTGTQTVTGTTATASGDFVGSCGGEGSPDRVYAFTLAGEGAIDATVTGFDAVLYLRGACADPASELACDDDSGAGGAARIMATLPAGAYALVVDGFSDTSGSYTLTATFTCTDSDLDDRLVDLAPQVVERGRR